MTQANQVSEGLIASFENLFGHIEVKVNALSLNSDFKGAADDLRQVWNERNDLKTEFDDEMAVIMNPIKYYVVITIK